jgi:Ca-activated chloride channel family protein
MTKRFPALISLFSIVLSAGSGPSAAVGQRDSPMKINVFLVQLNVAVTDRKGNYVTGLRPEDFEIVEDKNIAETTSSFEEGKEPVRNLLENVALDTRPMASTPDPALAGAAAVTGPQSIGSNVFVLFDTSNYMYSGFVFAQDAIADFIRSLEGVNQVGLYSYSRNLSRVSTLTPERSKVLRAVRSTVAGDEAALYNSLLLTVKDAAPLTGRKAIVVFSNGPDDASLVPPEDVAELAQSTGTIIYMISTRAAEAEPISAAVFERISKVTGGKAYFSKDWRDEKKAFASIRDDLAHLYSLSYYPKSNANRGWRNITVRLVGKNLQQYHVRTRAGYRLAQTQLTAGAASSSSPESAAN